MTAQARTRGRPRTKPAQMRREELMDAAQQLFLQKSIAGTSIDDIVSAADVAKGTFYLYFQSKEALLGALQERFIDMFVARLDAAMERCGPGHWRERLAAWVKTMVEGYLEHVALHDVIFHEVQSYDRRGMNDNLAIDQLTTLLRDGAKAGTWTTEEPRTTAIMFFHGLHGAVDEAIAKSPRLNQARLIRTITNFVERAVTAR